MLIYYKIYVKKRRELCFILKKFIYLNKIKKFLNDIYFQTKIYKKNIRNFLRKINNFTYI
jgi:hypothetical protein